MKNRVNDQINTKSALLILFLVYVSAGLVCQNLSTSLQQQQKDDIFLSFFLSSSLIALWLGDYATYEMIQVAEFVAEWGFDPNPLVAVVG